MGFGKALRSTDVHDRRA